MERAQQEVDRLENRKTMLESSKKDAQKKVSNLNLALINCENEERNLRNNLKLIVNSAEKDAVVRELQGLGKTLEDYRVPQLIRDIQQLEDQLERCKLKVYFHLKICWWISGQEYRERGKFHFTENNVKSCQGLGSSGLEEKSD